MSFLKYDRMIHPPPRQQLQHFHSNLAKMSLHPCCFFGSFQHGRSLFGNGIYPGKKQKQQPEDRARLAF